MFVHYLAKLSVEAENVYMSVPQIYSEKDIWEQVYMLWCQGAQNFGPFNHKLKIYTNVHHMIAVPDRETDRQTNIMAIARRFVLSNASSAKKQQ